MRLDHEFTVPAPIGEVWQAVVDPERVAPCMPGATLTKVEGDKFSGTVKVKLGPISLLYKGNGEFLEKDEAARKVTIKASGKDSRGAGTAAATVTLTLTEADGGTHGSVATDLAITGKPAQFGRGLISEVGGKILDTFAGCLSGKLAPPEGAASAAPAAQRASAGDAPATETAAQGARAGNAPAPGSAAAAPAAAAAAQPAAAQPVAAPAAKPVAEQGAPTATSEPVAKPQPAVKPAPTTPEINTEPKPKPADRPALHSVPAPPETEAIDLLDYAGKSVLKRVAPVLAAIAAVAGLVAIVRALRK
ncbi:carbon monoxide dehydrogenase subunit G [Amycolatopsis mediterranei S699]|uniref:Carbon monoxide dehydrogenase subunit G n=2 Tax=Amycolatopsis mediterranei TaxID=33910 RepID=A0A0H3CZ95_AMYMU|nr:SRPBCC family protein [Amycolatopsis mediterranei]ADJ43683.1 carbon monoxide dehydrogenase subunit G [Amycolatopsis mediterranei U32]AEK40391.1 carbon monoxide dehydrogenase subunit G [Amycolatopsis mediterranei S699]AFO75395.1 carbon monoxide dehydrogenase subunit G [Amycolatopsis mediterranei S699]AGT82524.1 carbon monoxide dehydrogenase subunit G [Amycolatopsis mediterranei RB]KDO10225.1 carbon monoxide dehydrogenase [Amycolatopsis mediterranei]